MKSVSFDELREKEVINVNDCRRLGYICDITVDIECGKIISFTVKNCTGIFQGKSDEIKVLWENVTKIGDDIIFVDICIALPQAAPCKPDKKKFFC